jgi:hypothetical protein
MRMLACYVEILKKCNKSEEKKKKKKKEYLCRQISMLDVFKSTAVSRASPRVLFDIGDDVADTPPTVQEEVPPS